MSILPVLWELSGEEHLMKQAILTLLSALMNSLKQESVKYHPLIFPLIRNSVEPGSVRLFPFPLLTCFLVWPPLLSLGLIAYEQTLGDSGLSFGRGFGSLVCYSYAVPGPSSSRPSLPSSRFIPDF